MFSAGAGWISIRQNRGEAIGYAIRLPANAVLQEWIGHLLTRPVGRPPKKPQVFFASFSYQAQSWSKPRRVVAEVAVPRALFAEILRRIDRLRGSPVVAA